MKRFTTSTTTTCCSRTTCRMLQRDSRTHTKLLCKYVHTFTESQSFHPVRGVFSFLKQNLKRGTGDLNRHGNEQTTVSHCFVLTIVLVSVFGMGQFIAFCCSLLKNSARNRSRRIGASKTTSTRLLRGTCGIVLC